MNSRVHIADRLRQSLDIVSRRGVPAQIANLLSPPTSEELGRRRAHLLALLLVAMIGAAGHVTGVTDRNAQYTVYLTAIAIAAVIGGLAPACVATLAAVLLADADAASSAGSAGRLMFACEGLAVAWVVGAMSDKLRETAAQLTSVVSVKGELSRQVHRGHLRHDAFEQLEDM